MVYSSCALGTFLEVACTNKVQAEAALCQLTRSKIKEFRHFRRILKRNLETLVEKGFLSSALVTDEDLVVVTRA